MQKTMIIMALAALGLAGCGDRDDAASEQMSAPAVSAPDTANATPPAVSNEKADADRPAATGTGSAIPPSDEVFAEPANPANTAQETTANPPDELTSQEASENMPQPGSVHSYSTPVREQTDQTTK